MRPTMLLTIFTNSEGSALDETQHGKETTDDASIEGTTADATNDCDWGDEEESPDPRVAIIGYN